MNANLALIQEVRSAGKSGSRERRQSMLREVTALFMAGAAEYSDEHVALFDEVIGCLATEIELSARALLAVCLAPIPNAPPKIVRKLAFDDAIEVAGPILRQSERLDDADLVENATQKGQAHL